MRCRAELFRWVCVAAYRKAVGVVVLLFLRRPYRGPTAG